MDLYTRKMNSTPGEFSQHLMNQGPIFWSPLEQIWVVTDHEIANSLLKGPDFSADRSSFFMSKMSGCPFSKVANFFGVVKKMMVTSDAPEHTQRRRLASSGMNDHILDHFVPRVRAVVLDLLKDMKGSSKVDFVQQVALPLPNIVLADLFSIPAEKRPDFYRWSNHMTQFFGGASADFMTDAENADRGALNLSSYFMQLMKERREQSQNDFISHMLRNQGSLDDSEVISQAAIMLVAGTVTTTDQICNNLYTFLTSGVWEKIVANPDVLESAIEEATRLDPSVNFIFRVAKKDVEIHGVHIKEGQMVFIANHAVNRNEKVFEKADEFVLERSRNPHLSYGTGIHYCLGARLGRIQMKELFHELAQKFPNLSLNAEQKPERKHQSLAFSGFESLSLHLGES